MILLSDMDLSLPLKNPVVIFSLVLFIILFAPILLNRFKIPHIIGLIIAGVIVGPYGLNLLLRDSSIVLFGTVGLLYIMFTAGLEIDMEEFRRNRLKSFVFGIYTFIVPMILGTLAGYYLLRFSLPSSLLLASMFASHTLLAYPIASKYGIARIRSVTLTIGGTIITDILALLVLATVTGMTKGEISTAFWVRLGISAVLFGLIIFLLFPLIARFFFKKFDDNISQYIFVLAMVFLGSFLAELAGLEAIVGAFLSGLALNPFIPHASGLMNRIEFVGNAFFIPFFLISVGMLVDFSVLFQGLGALKVAAVMIVLAVLSKYLAAYATRKTFRLSANEFRMIFGLSTARVGATLAVVLVGYNIIIGETAAGEPMRLLNEDILNGTILMILVTCTISSFVVEKASQRLALSEENKSEPGTEQHRILISLAYPDTVDALVDFGMLLKPRKNEAPLFALHIISDETEEKATPAGGRKMMEQAMKRAAAAEETIIPLTRFDMNISNGIVYTIREQHISDVLIGLHQEADASSFLGPTAEKILWKTSETIYIYKAVQPVNTLRRMVVVVTPRAELEPGFSHWVARLSTVARGAGIPMVYYAQGSTIAQLRELAAARQPSATIEYNSFENWEDFLILSRELRPNDLFAIVASRKGHPSYQTHLDKLPHYLSNYFTGNSFLLLYPEQLEHGLKMEDVQHVDSALLETLAGREGVVTKAGSWFRKMLNRKS